MPYLRISVPLSLLVLAACTSASGELGADPGALEVTPTGPDSTGATFIARSPIVGAGDVLVPTEIELPGFAGAFGLDQVREVRVGPFRFVGGTVGGPGASTYFEGTLEAELGKQTVLAFGGVKMRTVGPRTFGLESPVASELIAPGVMPGLAKSELVLSPGVGDGVVVPVLPARTGSIGASRTGSTST